MDYYALLPFAVFYSASLLFYRMYPRRNEHEAIRAFMFGILSVMFWGLVDFLLWIPIDTKITYILVRLAPYGWFGIGYSGIRFIYAYLGYARDFSYRLIEAIIVLVYLVYSFFAWSAFVPYQISLNKYGFYGSWMVIFSLLTFTLPSARTLWLAIRAWKVEIYPGRRRILGYFFISGTLAVIFGLVSRRVAIELGIPAPAISFISTLVINLNIIFVIERYGFFGFNLSIIGRDLFDSMRDGVLLLNKENRVINMNPSAEQILRIKSERLPLPLNEILPEVSQSSDENNFMIERAGEFHFLSFSTALLHDSWNGSLQLLMLHDLTDVRRAEKRANEMELKQKVGMAIELERQRVARDLHDGVNQTLYSIKLIVEVLPVLLRKNPNSAQRRIGELHNLAQNALVEMRYLMLELRPERVLQTPLPDLLHLLSKVDSFINKDISIITDIEDDIPHLPPLVNLAFYRIAQESIINVVRHAPSSTLKVAYWKEQEFMILHVEDNGAGFIVDEVKGDHFGLNNMRERAEEIGATLRIKSSPGNGTSIKLSWALHAGEEKNE